MLEQRDRMFAQSICDGRTNTNNVQHFALLILRNADSEPVWQAIDDG
jgi:hypothetical protein